MDLSASERSARWGQSAYALGVTIVDTPTSPNPSSGVRTAMAQAGAAPRMICAMIPLPPSPRTCFKVVLPKPLIRLVRRSGSDVPRLPIPLILFSQNSREICRLYFTKGRCFMRHCRHSHDILDLARLPPDHKLVLKNSEKLREALAAQVAAESATTASTSSSASHEPPAISDTAKKRQKGPRKVRRAWANHEYVLTVPW